MKKINFFLLMLLLASCTEKTEGIHGVDDLKADLEFAIGDLAIGFRVALELGNYEEAVRQKHAIEEEVLKLRNTYENFDELFQQMLEESKQNKPSRRTNNIDFRAEPCVDDNGDLVDGGPNDEAKCFRRCDGRTNMDDCNVWESLLVGIYSMPCPDKPVEILYECMQSVICETC